jgi:hypothetical protein
MLHRELEILNEWTKESIDVLDPDYIQVHIDPVFESLMD